MTPERVQPSFATDPLRFIAPLTSEKLIVYIYIHFYLSLAEKLSRVSQLHANREFTNSVCSNNGAASMTSSRNVQSYSDSHVLL